MRFLDFTTGPTDNLLLEVRVEASEHDLFQRVEATNHSFSYNSSDYNESFATLVSHHPCLTTIPPQSKISMTREAPLTLIPHMGSVIDDLLMLDPFMLTPPIFALTLGPTTFQQK